MSAPTARRHGALAVLTVALQPALLLLVAPAAAGALGVSTGAVGTAVGIDLLGMGLGALAGVALRGRRPRGDDARTPGPSSSSVALAGPVLIALGLTATALATDVRALRLAALLTGVGAGWIVPFALARTDGLRAAARLVAGLVAGVGVAAASVVLLMSGLDLTWRAPAAALAVFAAAVAGVVLPGRRPASSEAPAPTELDAEVDAEVDVDADAKLGFAESLRRLLLAPGVRRLVLAAGVLGAPLTALVPALLRLGEQRWGFDDAASASLTLQAALASFVGLLALSLSLSLSNGRLGGRRTGHPAPTSPGVPSDPSGLTGLSARAATAGAASAVAVTVLARWDGSTAAAVVAVAAVLAFAACLVAAALVLAVMLSLVRPELRSHAVALLTASTVVGGGVLGAIVASSAASRFGPVAAVVAMALPSGAAALLLRSAAPLVATDLARRTDEIAEAAMLRSAAAAGRRPSLLACRGIDFSYGAMQVLFDVDLAVEEGEMVALLGTNGAGKSTLLKVVSGLGLPERGSVRLDGADITFVDAERRVGLGISQIPGGRATFPPLTVVENLRLYGYSLGHDRRRIDAGIDATFAAFPRLAERRNQAAGTMSGGEQQMLALGKALLLQPRLLAIDELSLGLAPIVVGELLEMVRAINATGTAVILVEQSVNVALSLVDRAYFMEKGEVRFEGPATELLDRPDLLRSVFLEGASKALSV